MCFPWQSNTGPAHDMDHISVAVDGPANLKRWITPSWNKAFY